MEIYFCSTGFSKLEMKAAIYPNFFLFKKKSRVSVLGSYGWIPSGKIGLKVCER